MFVLCYNIVQITRSSSTKGGILVTINEHINAIYSAVTTMSEKELKDLENSLNIILSDVRSCLNMQTHSRLHHPAPAESEKK